MRQGGQVFPGTPGTLHKAPHHLASRVLPSPVQYELSYAIVYFCKHLHGMW